MVKRGMTPERAKELRKAKGIEETKLQKLRIEKELSQNDLAVKSGVTLRAIQCYEQQTRPIDGARLGTLCDLAATLDCKIEDILEDKELIEKFRFVK